MSPTARKVATTARTAVRAARSARLNATISRCERTPVSGSSVTPGQTITYTLNVVVSNAATTAPLTLTDTIGAGLTFGAVTSAGAFSCNAANPLVCTLPVNTPIGSYPVTYTATVDAGAAAGTTVANSVATDPTNNGGDQTPSCPTTASG